MSGLAEIVGEAADGAEVFGDGGDTLGGGVDGGDTLGGGGDGDDDDMSDGLGGGDDDDMSDGVSDGGDDANGGDEDNGGDNANDNEAATDDSEVEALENEQAPNPDAVDPQDNPSVIKFLATELAKGAAMQAGMLGLQEILKLYQANTPIALLTTAVNSAFTTLNDVVSSDWHIFLQKNLNNAPSLGSVTFNGLSFTYYDLFKGNVAKMDTVRTTVVSPAMDKANTMKDLPSMQNLQAAIQQWGQQASTIANAIPTNDSTLVAAGLKDHISDVNAAMAALN